MTDPGLRARAAREITQATGLSLAGQGEMSFALLPLPRLYVHDLKLADGGGAVTVEAESIQCDLALLPLLGSRAEIAAVTLDAARIRAAFSGGPAHALQPQAEVSNRNSRQLQRITLRNSSISIAAGGDSAGVTLTGVNAAFDWPFADAPASFAGQAQVFGAAADISGFIAQPSALRNGGATPATLRLSAPALTLALDGALRDDAGLRFDGKLHGAAPALSALLGMREGEAAASGYGILESAASSLDADIGVSAAGAQLSSARLAVGEAQLEGSLRAAIADPGTRDARLALSGTLAAADLALTLFSGWAPAWLDAQGQWTSARFDVSWLRRADVDLRISAARAHFGALSGEDAALSLLIRSGRFDIALSEVQAYGGRGKAAVAGALTAGGLEAKGEVQFADIDLARLALDLPGIARLSGTASGHSRISARGASASELVAGLAGNAELGLSNGEIQGLNFEQALRRLERKPGSVPTALASGRTPFDSLTIPAQIANGVARIGEGVLTGPGVRAVFRGDIDLARLRVAVTSLAKLNGPPAEAGAVPQSLAVDISGGLGDLAIVPQLVGIPGVVIGTP